MFFENNNNSENAKQNTLERVITKNDKAIQELVIRMDMLDREIKILMDELKVTPEQISSYIANQENFTSENWEELQAQRQMLDEKLQRDIENVRNPQKNQRRQTDRQVARHWLFVR